VREDLPIADTVLVVVTIFPGTPCATDGQRLVERGRFLLNCPKAPGNIPRHLPGWLQSKQTAVSPLLTILSFGTTRQLRRCDSLLRYELATTYHGLNCTGACCYGG